VQEAQIRVHMMRDLQRARLGEIRFGEICARARGALVHGKGVMMKASEQQPLLGSDTPIQPLGLSFRKIPAARRS
jgi:hypothetical protein